MKLNKLHKIASLIILMGCQTACNYLDVIPPAKPDYDDTMKDKETTEDYLYTCYSYVPDCHPFHYKGIESSTDEFVEPSQWGNNGQLVAWGTYSPNNDAYNMQHGGIELNIWKSSYNYIGYIHRFLDLIEELEPVGVTEDDKLQYKAECWFLEAYYYFRVLAAYGPFPIIKETVDPNITKEEIPGRSHFDACVDYIVQKLDDAANVLPPHRADAELGRATSVICKALKSRVLLYAASDLWNGRFPFPNWKNRNFETEGYGKELVSNKYDRSKWERALTACIEAEEIARANGYELFDLTAADAKAATDRVGLPYVPGKEGNDEFRRRVRMFQYLSTANEGDGNKEIIWGQRIRGDVTGNYRENFLCRLPNKVVVPSVNWLVGGWSGIAPTLYTVQHFYTENGKLPEKDPSYYPENKWYERLDKDATSPELATGLDGEDIKADIIKLNARREARFYAWIVFDGGQYGLKINDGDPLWLNLKNKNTNGYSNGMRNFAGTGYLSRKFVDPNLQFRASDGGHSDVPSRRPFIRLAEIYLNMAECYAALEDTENALIWLNKIRERAGINELSAADITPDMTLTDWVRNERFVELYEEGHRYYDVRRWCIAPEMLNENAREGLNAFVENPTFEEFNKPVKIDQPFRWDNRLYLLPIWTRSGQDELYSNPQMVQAPGY